ncbi:hypothetical protein [Deinococcus multiflagellatus]|uniref:Uncharacterized protein n=1 Tax=Deinococcus multiflagellatus TaxID=1656887 RepID=A0ABW1ZH89_9DEIO|nr:hypothetical protein [Deinococcus multiflagellatus]MBZ9713652.1 hypothetical protein [Deinococcus multiflagellatus]
MTNAASLQLSSALWGTFSALLDGPATPRALANRLGRPLAIIVQDLQRLCSQNMVIEDGTERTGRFVERRYRLPEGALQIHDQSALPLALRETERGYYRATLRQLPAAGGLVAVSVEPALMHEALTRTRHLLDELERASQPGTGVRFNLLSVGYQEDV